MKGILPVFFSVAVTGLFAQIEPPIGLFGPVTEHLKAGDFAPDIRFDATLHSATGIPWTQGNLSARSSVLIFLLDTHDNPELVTRWNALVEKFGEKMQFIWITAEKESDIRPWLEQHPISGWVFNDPKGQTGQAYGLELPAIVFIGADHRIVGFDGGILPTEQALSAVIEGRITHTAPKQPATMAEALAQAKASSASDLVYIAAEPPRMPHAENHKPDFAPSHMLHISPAKDQLGGDNSSGDDYWSLKGFTLKNALMEITGLSASRIDLPASLDTRARSDFALVLPAPEDKEYMRTLMQQEIERQFHIVSTHENRKRDVYVLTASEKKPAAAAADSQFGGFSSMDVVYALSGPDRDVDPRDFKLPGIGDIGSIGTSGTVDEFCKMLEMDLDRPVVNETGLEGNFEFRVKGSDPRPDAPPAHDFVERLRDQLGLIVTEEQRNVDTLVFTLRTP